MRFGKKLKEHVSTQTLPKECYVDYKGLKAAIKSGCSEDVFQELYNAGARLKLCLRFASCAGAAGACDTASDSASPSPSHVAQLGAAGRCLP